MLLFTNIKRSESYVHIMIDYSLFMNIVMYKRVDKLNRSLEFKKLCIYITVH